MRPRQIDLQRIGRVGAKGPAVILQSGQRKAVEKRILFPGLQPCLAVQRILNMWGLALFPPPVSLRLSSLR